MACFWSLFGVVFDTLGSLFVNMCSIGESFEFEWIPGREGWSPESRDPRKLRVKGSSRALGGGYRWGEQITVLQH